MRMHIEDTVIGMGKEKISRLADLFHSLLCAERIGTVSWRHRVTPNSSKPKAFYPFMDVYGSGVVRFWSDRILRRTS